MEAGCQPLAELFEKYSSDKGRRVYGLWDEEALCVERANNYAPFYEEKLGPMRDKPIRLLEIGLCLRDYYDKDRLNIIPSLWSWRDWFPNATLIGFDIVNFAEQADGNRIYIMQGDQGSKEDLEQLAADYGPFDVIIDDGSHRSDHHILTFSILFPHMKDGGLYFIEDIADPVCEYIREDNTMTREFLQWVGTMAKVEYFKNQHGNLELACIERNGKLHAVR